MSIDYVELTILPSDKVITQIEYDINQKECFVCLDADNMMSIIVLECCKQHIHERCLVDWILSKSNHDCAVCRAEITNLHEIIPINKFLNFVNIILQERDISKNKIRDILIDLYGTEPLVEVFVKNMNKQESNNRFACVVPECFQIVCSNTTMCLFMILAFVLLIVYVLSFDV